MLRALRRRYKTVRLAVRLSWNLIFALYNGVLAVLSSSLILGASCVYYLLLSAMRISAVAVRRRSGHAVERRVTAAIGILLIVLSVLFHGIVLISMRYGTAAAYGLIPMLAIATYTFGKIVVAIVSAVRNRKNALPLRRAINRIRYSEMAVSLLNMQQSMLVTFGEAGDTSSTVLNALCGGGACFFILWMGMDTLQNARGEYTMAKSKLVQNSEKIAAVATDTYKKIESGVVSGYKKIESGTVRCYTKIEDRFVDRYLTKEDETVEQAKARLKNRSKE